MVPKKRFFQDYIPTITAVKTWCDSETSWLIAQAWWKIWKTGEHLVKTWWISRTWWKPVAFPKPCEFSKTGKRRGEFPKTWWTWWLFSKRGENLVNLQNLVKTRLMPKPGENLVKAWWIHQVFTKQTKEAFCALKDPSKTLVAFPTRTSIVKTLVAFQNQQINNSNKSYYQP